MLPFGRSMDGEHCLSRPIWKSVHKYCVCTFAGVREPLLQKRGEQIQSVIFTFLIENNNFNIQLQLFYGLQYFTQNGKITIYNCWAFTKLYHSQIGKLIEWWHNKAISALQSDSLVAGCSTSQLSPLHKVCAARVVSHHSLAFSWATFPSVWNVGKVVLRAKCHPTEINSKQPNVNGKYNDLQITTKITSHCSMF